MRTVLRLTLGAAILLTVHASGHTGEEDQAKAVIQKALQAAGGADKLAEHQAGTWRARGIFHGFGGVRFTLDGARQGADQVALTSVSTVPGGTFTRIFVVNRDQGWLVMNGQLRDLGKAELAEEKERLYSNWVASLAPLKNPRFRLKYIGESKVGDNTAIGVEVASDGHRPVRLFFDRETGLLAKRQTGVKDMQRPDKEIIEDVIFSDYQAVDGVKHATKVKLLMDGKLTSEIDVITNRPVKQMDEKHFAKPAPGQ